ncbi:MAG TPA: hypothetical protein VEQ63_04055, partial [Bryobacteraceae bacterium]|nr:hypothetical protein [Bryobacteraceae bacterium]
MKLHQVLFAALTFCVVAPSAELIVNGSFEEGDFESCSNGSYCRLLSGSDALFGWEVGGIAVDWHNSLEMML